MIVTRRISSQSLPGWIWTEENILRFLALYRARSCLWDPRHPKYLDAALRARLYDEIAQDMNTCFVDGQECLKFLSILKNKYLEEKRIKRAQCQRPRWFRVIDRMVKNVANPCRTPSSMTLSSVATSYQQSCRSHTGSLKNLDGSYCDCTDDCTSSLLDRSCASFRSRNCSAASRDGDRDSDSNAISYFSQLTEPKDDWSCKPIDSDYLVCQENDGTAKPRVDTRSNWSSESDKPSEPQGLRDDWSCNTIDSKHVVCQANDDDASSEPRDDATCGSSLVSDDDDDASNDSCSSEDTKGSRDSECVCSTSESSSSAESITDQLRKMILLIRPPSGDLRSNSLPSITDYCCYQF